YKPLRFPPCGEPRRGAFDGTFRNLCFRAGIAEREGSCTALLRVNALLAGCKPAPSMMSRRLFVFEDLTERLIVFIPDEFVPVGEPGEQIIQAGNHKDSDQSAHEHAADGGGANRAVSDRPGTGGA